MLLPIRCPHSSSPGNTKTVQNTKLQKKIMVFLRIIHLQAAHPFILDAGLFCLSFFSLDASSHYLWTLPLALYNFWTLLSHIGLSLDTSSLYLWTLPLSYWLFSGHFISLSLDTSSLYLWTLHLFISGRFLSHIVFSLENCG